MGLFRRRDRAGHDPSGTDRSAADEERDREIATLRATVDELRRELALRIDADSRDLRHEITELRAELAGRVDALDQRLATPLSDPPPAPPPDPTIALAELEERIAALDARLTAVSSELANQLAELGTDLDALTRLDPDQIAASVAEVRDAAGALSGRLDALTEELDETRAARIVLANEQVRAQIALRRDLARAVDELRRPQR